MVSRIISQDIMVYLHDMQGLSVEELADTTLLTVEEVLLVLQGKKSFQPTNITSIIKNIETPLLRLISDACPEKHLDGRMKENVVFYKKMKKSKKSKKNDGK